MIKNGTRLQSQVCDTQVIVVRSSESLDDLRSGLARVKLPALIKTRRLGYDGKGQALIRVARDAEDA